MRSVVVLCVLLFGAGLVSGQEKQPEASSHATLKEFEANLQQYLKIREQASRSLPDVKSKDEPAAVLARQKALATALRRARQTAQPGDILTPAAQSYFRSLTLGKVRAAGGQAVKETIKQGNPPADKEGANVKMQINGAYPKAAPKATMPASLLARFPKLPEDLEYRFVGRTLILLDTAADIIIDYAPEVGPSL